MKQKNKTRLARAAMTLLLALLTTFGAWAQTTVTIGEGTATSSNIPVYGYSGDTQGTTSEFVIPATELEDLNGKEITALKFYVSSAAGDAWTATFQVYMKEIDETTLSATTGPGNCTVVYTGTLDATGTTMDVVFDESFTYNGGNLLIGTYVQTAGNWESASFYGIEATGAAYQSGGYNQNGAKNFIPKTTFTYETPSSCAKPSNLNVDYTEGSNTATVTWEGEASKYNINVNGTVTNNVTSPYTLSVVPGTTYNINLQSDCGEEQSGWVSTSFFSGCTGISVPYTYGFEDASSFDCWTVEYSDDSYAGITTNLPRTGDQCFWFYYTTNPGQYLISPQLSGITNGLHVEFWYRGYDNGVETFQVGYSTTDNDPDSFTWGDEITASTSYKRFSANYPAGTKYVAVKHLSDDQYYLFLDDFLFEESASCLEPTGLSISNTSTTGATLSWTAGGSETAWDIFVTDDNTVVPGEATTPTISGVDANTYNLTALNPCTIYYVYVRSACSSTDASAWSSPVIFHTECEPMALPYSYDFEDDDLPVSWSTIVENTSYTGINLMSTTETNQVLAFYMGTYQNPALIAVLPEVDVTNYPLNGYQISFDACYANTSTSNMTAGKLAIGIMTDPTDASTFELVEEVGITDGYTTFGSHTVMFNNYTGNGRYIALKDIYTQGGYVLVDNVAVTALPSCLPPTNVAVDGGKNAVVTWEGDATSYDVAFSMDGTVEPDDAIIGSTEENEFELSTHTQVGDNFVWVRANCSETEHSEWVAISFNVGYCTPNPTSHDGSGITGVSFGTGDYVVTNGDGSASLPASAPYYGDYTSMIGAVQAGVESTIAITTGTGSYPYTFVIWVDLDNSMTFEDSDIVYIGKASSGNGTLNATITIPATQATGDYRMRIYGADSYFSSFYNNGTTNWEAAHDPCSSGSYRHAHDYTLRVLEAPSCLAAANITFEDITSTSAVISWTNNNGVEATYTVMQGETVLTTTAVDSYTLTGLTAATYYPAGTFTIVSNCDETMIANVPAFTTLCEDITTLPWSEDFEGFENNTVPMCWDNSASTSYISNSSSSPNYIWGVVTVNDNNMMKMENYWAQTGTALINTPTIVLPSEGEYYLTFDYAHNATCGAFAIKVSVDGGATFTELASYTKGSGSSHTEPGEFTPATISLADYAGKSIMLQFFANANYGSGAIFVDNVMISAPAVIALSDSENNNQTISDNVDVLANVTLANRTLFKDGTWNTFCVPFDVALANSPLAGATVMELDVVGTYDGHQTGRDGETDNYYLFFKDASSIKAGKPYFVKWTTTGDDIVGPEFKGVTITTTEPTDIVATGITMKGNFSPVQVTANDMTTYFLMGDNKLYYTTVDRMLYNFRAYFKLDDASSAPNFTLGFDEGGTTRIFSIGKPQIEEGAWYDLNGRKYTEMPTAKGLYIHNGVKVIVK